jgi:hypothetical protein
MKRHAVRRLFALLLAGVMAFMPAGQFGPLSPIPAKASLLDAPGDCFNAAKDGVELVAREAERVVDPTFLSCTAQVASLNVVSIAVDAAFGVWGVAGGTFSDPGTCETALQTTLEGPIIDLFTALGNTGTGQAVESFLNSTILALINASDLSKLIGVDPPLQDPVTVQSLLAAGADVLYNALKNAVPEIWNYLDCGCMVAGTAIAATKDAIQVGKEAWQCVQDFCIFDCDDDPPVPPNGFEVDCAPGTRDQTIQTSKTCDYPKTSGTPASQCGTAVVVQSGSGLYDTNTKSACTGCGKGAVTTSYLKLLNGPDIRLPGSLVVPDPAIVAGSYQQCECPTGQCYQSTGMAYEANVGTGALSDQPIQQYGCAAPPKYAAIGTNGTQCITCVGGQGVVDFLGSPTCHTCKDGEGTREDGTCGVCTDGEGLFLGKCQTCPDGAANIDGNCTYCAAGTKISDDKKSCPTICTKPLVWQYDDKDKNHCIPCGENFYAAYPTAFTQLIGMQIDAGGSCFECAWDQISKPGSSKCEPLVCTYGYNPTRPHECRHCTGFIENNYLGHPQKTPTGCDGPAAPKIDVPVRVNIPRTKPVTSGPGIQMQTQQPQVKQTSPGVEKGALSAPVIVLPGGGVGSSLPPASSITRGR